MRRWSTMTARAIDSPNRSEPMSGLIRQMLATLEPFFTIRVTMPARAIQAFLMVAEKEDQSVGWYAQRAGISLTTMSRNLLDLADRDRNFDEGAGLIEGHENPMNRREKLYRLTPKGRSLLVRIGQRGGIK